LHKNIPTRQVHLDFHTSPMIPGIGSNFSKVNFQAALKAGNLESITVFAKCHHGLCYYPTKVGTMHPGLKFDLTGAMIDAAHEIGVRAPIYIPMGWSHLDALEHPEWVSKNQDGTYKATKSFKEMTDPDAPFGRVAWQLLCLNDGPYMEHLYELTEEICQRYAVVDGLFYDICFNGKSCFCDRCKAAMKSLGMDPESEADAESYYRQQRIAFMKKCGEILHKYHPEATIFFNGGADMHRPEYHPYETHYEMEDLPTAWHGYDKFPLRAKFFNNTGKGYIGMTGKFHLDWGEFGGFKTKEALKYEIATMAMCGAGASVGDHMHPDGEMELQTYETIGYAYRYLEQIAPYCYGGEPVRNLGICLSGTQEADEGLSRILLENQIDYGIVENWNFSDFDTVIIPENVVLDTEALDALKKYLEKGGNLLLTGNALVKYGTFQLDLGLRYLGEPTYDCDYIVSREPPEQLPNAPLLCYKPGHHTAVTDAQVLCDLMEPYFSRTYRHYCGHKNTPQDKNAARYPAIAKKGNIVYLAHDLPTQYFTTGAIYHKRYFMYALNLLHKNLFRVEGLGAQGRATVIRQPEQNRYCVNMTYAAPVKRGAAEVIEDLLPVYNIRCSLKTDKTVKAVSLPLTEQALEFTQKEGVVSFTVPKLECHTTVVIDYV